MRLVLCGRGVAARTNDENGNTNFSLSSAIYLPHPTVPQGISKFNNRTSKRCYVELQNEITRSLIPVTSLFSFIYIQLGTFNFQLTIFPLWFGDVNL